MGGPPDDQLQARARKRLRAHWSRWSAIVELFALRRAARKRIDPAAYKRLHGELIASCRATTGAVDGEARRYLEGLEALAGPWLDPRTLAQADREILEGLLGRCRLVERELGGPGRCPPALDRWIKALPGVLAQVGRMLSMVLALIGLISLLGAAGVDLASTVDGVGGRVNVLWLTAKRASDDQKWGGLAVAVISAAIFLVRRTARN